jgi:hypothetical protein
MCFPFYSLTGRDRLSSSLSSADARVDRRPLSEKRNKNGDKYRSLS